MKRLYDTNGHLKPELVHDVLKKARLDKGLPNIPEIKMERLAEKFIRELDGSRLKVGDLITKDEVGYVIERMRRNKHDGLMDKDIQAFKEVILNSDAHAR